MITIKIPKRLLKHPSMYLFDGNQYDLLGCFLLHNGIVIPEKIRFPSELKIVIPHITFKLRNKFVDSPLAIQILQLDYSPQKTALVRVNELLASIDREIQIV